VVFARSRPAAERRFGFLLDFVRPSTPQCKRGLAILTGAAGFVCALVAVWCLLHAIDVFSGLQEASGTGCGTCYASMVDALGMPLEKTIPLGVLSCGCALVAGVQTVRFANGARGAGAGAA
jgi:hypothetical protein